VSDVKIVSVKTPLHEGFFILRHYNIIMEETKKLERHIYRITIGAKEYRKDPMRLHAKIKTCYPEGFQLQADVKLMSSALTANKPEALEAATRICKYAKEVFGFKDIEDSEDGVTDAEAMLQLFHFTKWLNEVQQDFFTGPKPLTPTESPPSSP